MRTFRVRRNRSSEATQQIRYRRTPESIHLICVRCPVAHEVDACAAVATSSTLSAAICAVVDPLGRGLAGIDSIVQNTTQ